MTILVIFTSIAVKKAFLQVFEKIILLTYTTNVAFNNTIGGMMGVPVRIDELIYNEAKKVARSEFRSIPNQIEFWAHLGKCALDNPDLPIELIKDIVMSQRQDKSLAEPFQLDTHRD